MTVETTLDRPVVWDAADSYDAGAEALRLVREAAWLDSARRSVGLPTWNGDGPRTNLTVFPPPPPLHGHASEAEAEANGVRWWRLFRQAEEEGAPLELTTLYRDVARRWFAILDRRAGVAR
jgi:hypothetical protein